ncbi:hypothetical protein BOVATA_049020 [Babesia ovata]|uniref:Uncharacterized protein n=1 Tax=Babesia ovata TaxID=189622 RepID=A0A2H6KKA1_9APIC|nr:uncharacterized protein BOVATA_049020 [Babesia ovata]GBE63409.1 hypothetical protein BOVATA_049020 [Babesia ovata]
MSSRGLLSCANFSGRIELRKLITEATHGKRTEESVGVKLEVIEEFLNGILGGRGGRVLVWGRGGSWGLDSTGQALDSRRLVFVDDLVNLFVLAFDQFVQRGEVGEFLLREALCDRLLCVKHGIGKGINGNCQLLFGFIDIHFDVMNPILQFSFQRVHQFLCSLSAFPNLLRHVLKLLGFLKDFVDAIAYDTVYVGLLGVKLILDCVETATDITFS